MTVSDLFGFLRMSHGVIAIYNRFGVQIVKSAFSAQGNGSNSLYEFIKFYSNKTVDLEKSRVWCGSSLIDLYLKD